MVAAVFCAIVVNEGPSTKLPTAGVGPITHVPAKIVDALDRLARGHRKFRQSIASRHGLTPLQLDLLLTLAAGPPPDPVVGLLAAELGVTQPTVTDSLRTLESKGLVSRDRRIGDRRQTGVTLTGSGAALVEGSKRADRELLNAITGMPLSAQEEALEVLLGLIGHMVSSGVIEVARTCVTCRFHRRANGGHRCTLLAVDLPVSELRVNCPEHEPAERTG